MQCNWYRVVQKNRVVGNCEPKKDTAILSRNAELIVEIYSPLDLAVNLW